jgi:hypothetical protein
MARRPPDPDPIDVEYVESEPRDVLDQFPRIERATTQLERSFGPSCLLSLIIVLLLLVLFKRYLQVPWIALACMAFLVWFGVLTLLVRWRPDRVTESDD